MLSKEKLLKVIENIEEFDEFTDEEKAEIDFVEETFVGLTDKSELFRSIEDDILSWSFYSVYYEKKEDYEFCARIRDMVDISIKDAKRIIDTYFELKEDDDAYLDSLSHNLRGVINENYNFFLKRNINKKR